MMLRETDRSARRARIGFRANRRDAGLTQDALIEDVAAVASSKDPFKVEPKVSEASRMRIGRILGGTVVAIALVSVGCSGSSVEDDTTRSEGGAITEEGDLGVFRIQVGDCIGGGLSDEVESVEGVPCNEPHEQEVYHVFDLPEGDGSYPGDISVAEQAESGCTTAFEPFVGLSYEASIYGINTLTPSMDTWDSVGDRPRRVEHG